jgi:hypothetical protein
MLVRDAHECRADVDCARSGGDRHLEHAVALVREQFVGFLDAVERKSMRDHRPKIDPARGDNVHQAAHALLAAGAERGDDPGVAEAGGEGIERAP